MHLVTVTQDPPDKYNLYYLRRKARATLLFWLSYHHIMSENVEGTLLFGHASFPSHQFQSR